MRVDWIRRGGQWPRIGDKSTAAAGGAQPTGSASGVTGLVLALCILAPQIGLAASEITRAVKVFDGDTIQLEDGRKVRYLGINAPEYQEPFYLKAKRFNEKLVLGKEIRLEFDEERSDGYERVLAYIYVDDILVNAELVEAGLAHAFFIGSGHKHDELFLRLQAEAKIKKVGIWSARGGAKDFKITTVRLADEVQPEPNTPYVRIASLSDGPLSLARFVLSNERGDRFVFPDITLEPGQTVVVSSASDGGGLRDANRQRVVFWPQQRSVWDTKEDTAFLFDPTGALVDRFHYKGRRVSSGARRGRR